MAPLLSQSIAEATCICDVPIHLHDLPDLILPPTYVVGFRQREGVRALSYKEELHDSRPPRQLTHLRNCRLAQRFLPKQ